MENKSDCGWSTMIMANYTLKDPSKMERELDLGSIIIEMGRQENIDPAGMIRVKSPYH